jgi:hypothetical protein
MACNKSSKRPEFGTGKAALSACPTCLRLASQVARDIRSCGDSSMRQRLGQPMCMETKRCHRFGHFVNASSTILGLALLFGEQAMTGSLLPETDRDTVRLETLR